MWLFIGPHEAGAVEGLMDEKDKEVDLISALPQAGGVGTYYNALPLSRPPFPHLQQWWGWAGVVHLSDPFQLCEIFSEI